jgi:hypothetical protein
MMQFCRRPLRARLVASVILLGQAVPSIAWAGPPFLTDDPEPTETHHWEIYAPAADAAGRGGDYEGSFGAELNYGAAPDLQITVGLPVAFAHEAGGFQTGRGDLELSVKYRFYHDEDAGLSIAVFPGVSAPTASGGLGNSKVTALLPIWVQKDIGSWSLFGGGGGYAIHPGTDNQNYWSGGVALAREIKSGFLIGMEVDRQGADTVDADAETSLGLGGIAQLTPTLRLLASAGPTFVDGGGHAGFHAFVALGLDF